MATLHVPPKATFKAPEEKPFKVAEHGQEEPKPQPRTDGWAPMDTAPQDANAVFVIRACANGKPVSGTETKVSYRASRKMVGGKWKPSFSIIDASLGTKLGFRPTEWRAATKAELEHSTWDEAIAKAAEVAKARNAGGSA